MVRPGGGVLEMEAVVMRTDGWLRWTRATLTTLVALSALACSQPTPAGPGGGTGLPDVGLPDAATGDADSGASAGDVTASEVIGDGGPIQAVQCVAPGQGECDENSECASDLYCDGCLRECKKPRKQCEPCSLDEQCKNAEVGSICMPFEGGGSHCTMVCVGDSGCPKGFACTEFAWLKNKQCMPKTGSCAPKSGLCKNDGQCPYGTICQAEYGKCINGCTSDNACSPPQVCSLFRCTDPCTSDKDCKVKAAAAVCENEHCKIPGGCLGPPECPEKETYCDMEAHLCKPGCKTTFDCKDFSKKCQGGKCVKVGCKENWECAFEQVCVPATGKCKKAEGKFCAPCDPDDENATACGGKPNRCFNFKDEEEKEHKHCGIVCSSAPEGPCPQGYDCMDLKDQDGKSQGKFCLRQCWNSPYPDKNP